MSTDDVTTGPATDGQCQDDPRVEIVASWLGSPDWERKTELFRDYYRRDARDLLARLDAAVPSPDRADRDGDTSGDDEPNPDDPRDGITEEARSYRRRRLAARSSPATEPGRVGLDDLFVPTKMPRTWWSPTWGLIQDVPTELYVHVATSDPLVSVPDDAVELTARDSSSLSGTADTDSAGGA